MSSSMDTADDFNADINAYAFKAYIKNIYLELPDYTYDHHPIQGDEGEIFLGRDGITQKLVNMLEKGDDRGAYLVTGYRGMGKTSYVKKAIVKYRKNLEDNADKPKVVSKHISFAQNDLKEIDILRQIAKFIKDELELNDRLHIINYLGRRSLIFFFSCAIFAINMFMGEKAFLKINFGDKDSIINNFIVSIILGLLLYQIIQFLLFIARKRPSIKSLINLHRKVELLYDRCQGEVSNEKGIESNNEQLPLGFIDKKSKKYQPLTSKEAEHELIDILDKFKGLNFYQYSFSAINFLFYCTIGLAIIALFLIPHLAEVAYLLFLSFFFAFQLETQSHFVGLLIFTLLFFIWQQKFWSITKFKKQFIYVFDELDKLDTQGGKGYFYENIAASTNIHYNTYTNDLRERKQVVLGLLSSLKYFITEANARFIFIAGREMFDASLADIADRQSSISSIFHQVIYIDSFYRDKPAGRPRASGIGEMVESYLETILIPAEFKGRFRQPEKKIKPDDYPRYFEDVHFLGNYYFYLKERHEKLKEEEILKIIFTLQNLIIYIAYRSNGSPKKMVRILEESIVSIKDKTAQDIIAEIEDKNKQSNQKLYLKLSFKKQYKLGFTSYLFRPFFLMYGTFLKGYGDSLLVSTPYLIDNLIKFHPFAFSVKNLELLPEVISSNKTPELRLFIEELIFFLSQNHIRETESGLFEYKFYEKTHNEIAYISKIAEEESAAFNFTLDENYPIKKHLAARIKELRNAHKDFGGEDNALPAHSMSISFLNNLLGDAELYDDEFEDAIISYSDALQALPHHKNIENFSIEQLVISMRLKLKLGLTYEKMKSFDHALSHYADALLQTQSFFKLKNQVQSFTDYSPSFRELLQLATQSLAALVYVQEKLEEGLTFQKIAAFNHTFQRLKENIKKNNYGGRDLIEANHYAQLGTIIFYKNMTLSHGFMRGIANDNQKIENLRTLFYSKSLQAYGLDFVQSSYNELKSGYADLIFPDKDHTQRDFRFSFAAYIYYKKCLSAFLIEKTKADTLKDLMKGAFEMMYHFENAHDKNLLRGIADVLTRLGDLLLTLFEINEVYCDEVFKEVRRIYSTITDDKSIIAKLDIAFKNCIEANKGGHCFDTNTHKVCLDDILFLYYLSGRFYLKSGRSNSTGFQFRKILLLIKSYTKFEARKTELVDFLEETFFKKALEFSSWNNNSSDRPQILKFKDYIGIESVITPPEYSKYVFLNLSNNPETKEVLLLLAAMKVKTDNYEPYQSLEDFAHSCPEQSLITPHNSISHQLTRIGELELQALINHKFLHENLYERFKKINSKPTQWINIYKISKLNGGLDMRIYRYKAETSPKLLAIELNILRNEHDTISENMNKLLREYYALVANSVHCIHQIINILKIYGVNHFLNNAYLGSFYEKMGDWLIHLRLCKILNEELDLGFEIDDTFNKLLGFRAIHALEVLPQYQLALQHYYRALQVHSEGSAYKFQISNFIYLEDDYNDNFYHFGAALERQRINVGEVRKRIEKLEKEAQRAIILQYGSFVNTKSFK